MSVLAKDASQLPRPSEKSTRVPSRAANVTLICLGVGVVLVIAALVGMSLWLQVSSYAVGLEKVAAGKPVNESALLVLATAWDIALTRLVALFLGAFLICIGTVLVLRAQGNKLINVSKGDTSAHAILASCSPGLILGALGVVLVVLVLFLNRVHGEKTMRNDEPIVSLSGGTQAGDRGPRVEPVAKGK